MNKFVIPAILVAVVMVAGAFAFMPVEKASTVHGNLSTAANVDAEADGQDRAVTFYYNMSHSPFPDDRVGGWQSNITIIRGTVGETLTGYASLTAIPNNSTGASDVGPQTTTTTSNHNYMNCGLSTTGQAEGNAPTPLGLNATGGVSNFTVFSAANGLTASEGIQVQLSNKTGPGGSNGMAGVCAGTIVLTNWGS